MTFESRGRAVTGEEIDSRPGDAEIARKRMRALALVKQELFDAAAYERPPQREPRVALSFPPFRLDVAEERLWKNGRELRIRPKPFAILRYLTQHPRRLVTRAEIVNAVWGRVVMAESVVRTHVYDLRQVLGENVIETVVGRGYRFLPDISNIDEACDVKRLAGKAPLEIVRTSETFSAGQPSDVPQAVRAADYGGMFKELTDALKASGIRATVLLLVGD